MRVRDAMTSSVATADIGHTVRDVAGIMRMEDCGFVPVLDAQRIVGVVTDRDLVIRAVADGAADPAEMPIAEVMTSGDLVTIDPDESLSTAAHMMSLRQVRRLAVTRDGQLEGVLTLGDLEQATHARGRDAREAMLSVTRPGLTTVGIFSRFGQRLRRPRHRQAPERDVPRDQVPTRAERDPAWHERTDTHVHHDHQEHSQQRPGRPAG